METEKCKSKAHHLVDQKEIVRVLRKVTPMAGPKLVV
jgi:hypothetical protein